jgi:hypothetical protein
MSIYLKYFIAWFPMLVIAILNGALRDLGYKKLVGELTAHQISTGSLILVFSLYIWFIVSRFPPHSGRQAILLGIFWVVLTLLFEFGFGLARGKALDELLADYNILKGRLWLLVPLFVATAPYLFYKILNTGQ